MKKYLQYLDLFIQASLIMGCLFSLVEMIHHDFFGILLLALGAYQLLIATGHSIYFLSNRMVNPLITYWVICILYFMVLSVTLNALDQDGFIMLHVSLLIAGYFFIQCLKIYQLIK